MSLSFESTPESFSPTLFRILKVSGSVEPFYFLMMTTNLFTLLDYVYAEPSIINDMQIYVCAGARKSI